MTSKASSIPDTGRVNLPGTADTCRRDYRDLTIVDLTHSLIEVEHQRDRYRELLQLTLSQLHDATITNRRLQARLRQFLDVRPRGYLDEQQQGYAA